MNLAAIRETVSPSWARYCLGPVGVGAGTGTGGFASVRRGEPS